MEILKKLAEKVKGLTVNDLIHELSESPEFTDLIIKLNTVNQLYDKGIDSRGRSLGDYAANTIEGTKLYKGKKEKGQRFDHITLNDTGDFYESFKINLDSNSDFSIEADTIKDSIEGTIDLLDAYGEDILGLTDESLKTLREKALEILIPYIKNVLLQ
jgi:hypothetical protein